uniref:DNA-directed RNA polymerase subunit beta' n=1 Tax=Cyanidium caldarium TaxID=2771 RepID=RPOC1_CYACA|nr:RNA polymerase beta' subunit [Cyanidium caldarium]O19897.2 RecName: Full=DNA-directed RNA polymerase subunit beta'; AltName: Full=PEP; AltName: Full=Plastid-encoded RNA polymerase subunit beta'; Short=RNA polymerase subunit beta' [Cyanidium caldarium]AAB82692.2 unknown [Cyanidium caldarium]WDB00159.1 RNA polymerase beta' subunit [Cyanidium caldarium]
MVSHQFLPYLDYIKICLASPERIRVWAQRILPNGQIVGEVTKPETINYRTLKPEMDGLFCERIFGPIKNWECHCGKYKRIKDKGIICERCGVEVTESKVRRHRMGYIELSAPVVHIWYLKGMPSYISVFLDMAAKEIEQVVYFNTYIITHSTAENKQIKYKQLLTEDEWVLIEDQIYRNEIQGEIEIGIGASAILKMLKDLDLSLESDLLRTKLVNLKAVKKDKIMKRLRIIDNFMVTGASPSWMVLNVIPVISPDLRPMVQLDGGRFATSDLNDLYRRVINRNNRLKRLEEILAPEIIIRNEKRMLQEAVDALIDNGRRGRVVVGANNRALKSLSNIIEGKQGRFRQNLLGKRVDYSGRSVIVVGPDLKLNECGIPKEMAIELFQPFLIHQIIKEGLANNMKSAKKLMQKHTSVTIELLQKIIKWHPVLLNRAPTLHRLGIQAFDPVLVDGRAIRLHPLVCPAFNADFDGDQMAVHIPLSIEAQTEARLLMLAPNNFLSPATGQPIITPSQDMVLGCYYLTNNNLANQKGSGHYFSSFEDAIIAYKQKLISLHAFIWVKFYGTINNLDIGRFIKSTLCKNKLTTTDYYENLQVKKDIEGTITCQFIKTSVGRIFFNIAISGNLFFSTSNHNK